jgi:hypothetical protein
MATILDRPVSAGPSEQQSCPRPFPGSAGDEVAGFA